MDENRLARHTIVNDFSQESTVRFIATMAWKAIVSSERVSQYGKHGQHCQH